MDQDRPSRDLDFKTVHNFRDLGGYPTQDGRHVRWRLIFRSGVMFNVDDNDRRRLCALGVVTICDLRTNGERSSKPTLWHRSQPIEFVEHDHEMSAGAIEDLVRNAQAGADDARAGMRQLYRDLAFEQAESYRNLFQRIAESRLPLVFNCSAGKDRTGVAAALLLTLLGVPRDLIIDDYALTNDSIDPLIRLMANDPVYGRFIAERRDVAMPILRAEPEYLAEMFAAVESEHGSIEAYLEDEICVTRMMRSAIQAQLLE